MEIQSFLVVAEELHFAKAAKRLNITAGGLSRRISHLEQALGVPVLYRTTRTVRLSAAGKEFAPVAHRLMAELNGMQFGRGNQPRTRTLGT